MTWLCLQYRNADSKVVGGARLTGGGTFLCVSGKRHLGKTGVLWVYPESENYFSGFLGYMYEGDSNKSWAPVLAATALILLCTPEPSQPVFPLFNQNFI